MVVDEFYLVQILQLVIVSTIVRVMVHVKLAEHLDSKAHVSQKNLEDLALVHLQDVQIV